MVVLFILGTGAAQPAWAQVESVIHTFTGANSTGKYLYGGLLRDSSGNLFGTTYQGGSKNLGTVFEEVYDASTHSYTEQSLFSFNGANGANPQAGLITDSNGNLYGTTKNGGANGQGTVFELSPPATAGGDWKQTTLYNFKGYNSASPSSSDGANPEAALIMDSSGNLYGTTYNGGSNSDGSVYELTKASGYSSEQFVYSFSGSDGANPQAALLMDSSDNLYGTTYNGGSGYGTVFELTKASGYSTEGFVYSFNYTLGANPAAGLVMDSSGNLYGTTAYGGSDGYGVTFELTQASAYATENVVQNFTGSNGEYSRAGLMKDSQGNLYGTTYGGGSSYGGTVFELTEASAYSTENVLHNFTGTDGKWPHASVLMDPSGNLYGTTYFGGPNSGEGAVYGIAPVTLSDSSLSISAGVGSSASKSVTLTNYGNGSLSFGTASISGANAADFAIGSTDTCSGQTVSSGSSCTVSVKFTPSVTTTETASLNVMECGITVAVGLAGSGASVTATLSPSLNFPGTLVGTSSAPQQVKLTNTSTSAALTIDSISVSANFTEGSTTCGATLAAGSSCTIDVTFSPTTTGSLTGTLTVADNTSSGSQSVSLSGDSLTPAQYIGQVMTPYVGSLGLNNGQTNSQLKNLSHALQMISADKINGALGNLNGFVGEVNGLYNAGILTQQQATTLVSEANAVINSLE